MKLQYNHLTKLPEITARSARKSFLATLALSILAAMLIEIGGWFSHILLVPVAILLTWHAFLSLVSFGAILLIQPWERYAARKSQSAR